MARQQNIIDMKIEIGTFRALGRDACQLVFLVPRKMALRNGARQLMYVRKTNCDRELVKVWRNLAVVYHAY